MRQPTQVSSHRNYSPNKLLVSDFLISVQLFQPQIYAELVQFSSSNNLPCITSPLLMNGRLTKEIELISSRGHCQRFSPLQTSSMVQAGFEPAQNLHSGFVE